MGSGLLCWEARGTESPSRSAAKQTLHSCHFTVICMADQKDEFLSGWFSTHTSASVLHKVKDFSVPQQPPSQVLAKAGCLGMPRTSWELLLGLVFTQSACAHLGVLQDIQTWLTLSVTAMIFLASKRGLIWHVLFSWLNSVFSLTEIQMQGCCCPCFLSQSVAYMPREKEISVLIITGCL